jgi:hypothetical protein
MTAVMPVAAALPAQQHPMTVRAAWLRGHPACRKPGAAWPALR